MNSGTRATVHENCNIAILLPGDSVNDVGIAGVKMYFGHTRVLIIDLAVAKAVSQDLVPACTTVDRLVEPTLAAG